MKNKISCILGEYKKNKVKIIILSKKSYDIKMNINKNHKEDINIIIKKYKTNAIVLDNIKEGAKYDILFIDKKTNKTIENICINLEKNPFDNVKIVNCDSNIGLETNTWKLMDNNFGVIFHLGDFLYNDLIFRKNYDNIKKNNINYKSCKQNIYEDLYDNYIECITRKIYYLKNNFNYIMTDDHETVDNIFFDKNKDDIIFMKIYKLFKKVEIDIFNNLRFEDKEIDFINDCTNKTVYVMNYKNKLLNNNIINKYNIYDRIRNYDNIIFLERKCFSNSRSSILSTLIFQEKEINKNNDDLYGLFDRLNNKNINIISGDYHIISTMDIYNKKSNSKICSVKNVGAINTCVNIFGIDLFIDSKKYDSKNEEVIYKNGFIYVNYKKDKINIVNIINTKTNLFYNTINNIITAIKFVFNK
jgi:hypothetical protein